MKKIVTIGVFLGAILVFSIFFSSHPKLLASPCRGRWAFNQEGVLVDVKGNKCVDIKN